MEDNKKLSGPDEAIAEVQRLAPDHYIQVEEILESMGFTRSVPMNDVYMLYLKRKKMPSWDLIDVETMMPMRVKDVVVEFSVKVRPTDLFMEAGDWRVISDGKWHEARLTDLMDSFEVML